MCALVCVCACRLIQHTNALMSSEEKLCIKVLRILQEMLIRTLDFDERVSSMPNEPNDEVPLSSKRHEGNSSLSLQGISLRKVLLLNYLFPNKKNNPKNDLAELGAAGTPHVTDTRLAHHVRQQRHLSVTVWTLSVIGYQFKSLYSVLMF